jgi:hypothetical protein
MCAALNLRSMALPGFALRGAVWDMSLLALVAGICAVAAGLWSTGRGHSWLLSLHGLALGLFGFIGVSPLVKGPLSFRPISLLFLVMAGSIAVFAWRAALRGVSVAFIAFALSFVAVGFGGIRLEPRSAYWIWMGSWFALCAIFMLYVALRARREGVAQTGPGVRSLSNRFRFSQ